jgi:pimeloyl-ACP methyl ester carboxylesterase
VTDESRSSQPPTTTPDALSIEEGAFIDVHGVEQWLAIRGTDLANPVVLIVTGPGVAYSRLTPLFMPWEKSFTLVQWDQPDAGATLQKNGRVAAPSLERLAADGIAVAEYIQRRLAVRKVVLLGLSGGTVTGLMMAKRRPELFSAYVGSGQFVNWARQEALSYQLALKWVRGLGDLPAIAELEQIGPPPYAEIASDQIKSKYAGAFSPAEQQAFASLEPSVAKAVNQPPPDATYLPKGLPVSDMRAASLQAYAAIRAELMRFDARALGLDWELPMIFVQGESDAYAVNSEVEAFVAELRAPAKVFATLAGGGHSAYFLTELFRSALVTQLARAARARS